MSNDILAKELRAIRRLLENMIAKNESSSEKMISVDKAAEMLGVKAPTVRKLCRAGQIRAFKKEKIWRISERSVKNYITSNTSTI